MKLDVGSIEVEGIEFGPRTGLRDRILVLHRDEIRHLVLEDPHFSDVEVHLARPGETVRVIHALDVVEPRWKVAGPGGVFPGFVTPPDRAGEGTTHRLAGVAVVATGDPVPGEPTHFRERLIDLTEGFDGALVRWHRGFAGATYWEQNHAVLTQLCRRHGRDLNFLGCILFAAITPTQSDKERVAGAVAKLARLLGAQAALCLGVNGSNYAIDMMLAIQKCEQAGIRTTLIYNDVGEGTDDPGFIFALP